jgi:metal-dependent amidase/aminoacylase/carboxypeptidase family protein
VGRRAVFHGIAAHAASAPEHGRNALNGVIRLFIGIDGWRQHLTPTTRVHGIITDGGSAVNVVPERAAAEFGLRAATLQALEDVIRVFDETARGAALQTGTTVELEEQMRMYQPVAADATLTEVLASELQARGVEPVHGSVVWASTDLGNVSQRVPTDWIRFPVSDAPIPGHSVAMRVASVTDLAHENALLTGEALAGAARAIIADPVVRARLSFAGGAAG